MRATLGIAAVAFFVVVSTSDAQETTCALRCTTIHQFFDDEIAATIPLACDEAAIYCKGEGALRINGEMVPTAISVEFTAIGLQMKVLSAQGPLDMGSGITFPNTAPTQTKTLTLLWPAPRAKNDFSARKGHALGGHLKLIVEHYERPVLKVPPPTKPL